jgi:hypothetical protein
MKRFFWNEFGNPSNYGGPFDSAEEAVKDADAKAFPSSTIMIYQEIAHGVPQVDGTFKWTTSA